MIDVTDPTRPFVRSKVTLPAQTVTCADAECRYAYSLTEFEPVTGEPFVPVIDLSDLDHPRRVAAFPSAVGAGHVTRYA